MQEENIQVRYKESEKRLQGNLFGLPKEISVDGFIYSELTRGLNDPLMFDADKALRYNSSNETYILSQEEVELLNSKKFEEWILNLYNEFRNHLKKFYLDNVGHHDYEMLSLFYRAIFFLNCENDIHVYNRGSIESAQLNKEHFLSIIKKERIEAITELEWRINRINPNNHYSYFPIDEEIKGYFNAIYYKGFELLNKSRFKENSKEIYDKLVPRFLDENTTVEEFHKLFSGKPEIFVKKIVWVNITIALTYFLRELKNKLIRMEIYKYGTNLFEMPDGGEFKKLKNYTDIPNCYKEIDEIISLF